MKIGVQVHLKSGKAANGIIVEAYSLKKLNDEITRKFHKRKTKFLEVEGVNEILSVPKENVEFIVYVKLSDVSPIDENASS